MEAVYAKDDQGAYQTLKINIEKDSETVFNLLSTTEGVGFLNYHLRNV